MTTYGIMQGRLVPPEPGRFQAFPRERWRNEFALAAEAGVDYIEWIYDDYGASANPITSPEGLAEFDRLKQRHGIATPALCGDWFMDFPFLRCTVGERRRRQDFLNKLLAVAQRIGAQRMVLPFVDQSSIQTEAENDIVLGVLAEALPTAEKAGVELHLETDLGPADFAALMARIPNPLVKINYDSGNSSGLGYIASEEFAAYGSRIGSIHIKDRLRKPDGSISTQALGNGSANFEDVFRCIRSIHYTGGLTLQVARGEAGDEVNWIRDQLAFLRSFPLSS